MKIAALPVPAPDDFQMAIYATRISPFSGNTTLLTSSGVVRVPKATFSRVCSVATIVGVYQSKGLAEAASCSALISAFVESPDPGSRFEASYFALRPSMNALILGSLFEFASPIAGISYVPAI